MKLDMDAQEPWRHHDVIVKQYPHHKHDEKHDRDGAHWNAIPPMLDHGLAMARPVVKDIASTL